MQDTNQRNLFIEGSAQAVRNTVQLYVPTECSKDSDWPIEQGDTYRGMVLDSGCVLLWPAGEAPDLPTTLEPPDARSIPWPLSSMGTPPPRWARLTPDLPLDDASDGPAESTAEEPDVSAESTD